MRKYESKVLSSSLQVLFTQDAGNWIGKRTGQDLLIKGRYIVFVD